MGRGRSGDGSLYKEKSSGLWAVSIELPPEKWRDDGTPVRNRKVQRFKRRDEAAAKLRELRDTKRRMGNLPNANITVQAWFTKWMTVHVIPHKRPRTADTYRTYVSSYIVPALGAKTLLSRITPDSVRSIETLIKRKNLSSTTARNAYHYATAALDAAVQEGYILNNPAHRVAAPRQAVTKLDVFSLDDAVLLLKHLMTHPDRALWLSYLLTGARRGEIAGMEVDRVGDVLDLSWQLQRLVYTHGCDGKCGKKRAGNCPDRVLEMPADYEVRQVVGGLHLTRPKSKSGWRVIPLVEPLRTVLLEHVAGMNPNPWGLLFAGKHGRYNTVTPPDPDRITAEWPTLRDEVFGKGRTVRLHDIRHSTVDLLYLAGIPEDVIVSIVGHSNRSMTRAYKSRTDRVRLTAAMEQLSALLGTKPAEIAPQQSAPGPVAQ